MKLKLVPLLAIKTINKGTNKLKKQQGRSEASKMAFTVAVMLFCSMAILEQKGPSVIRSIIIPLQIKNFTDKEEKRL